MAMPTLRYGDGFPDIAPDLHDFVKILQLALKNLGYSINTDGLFNRETEKVVIKFQQSKGLKDDGIVRESTWDRISRSIRIQKPQSPIPIDTSETVRLTLRYRDGYSTTTPHLSGVVKRLQTLLKDLEYSIFVDGLFNKSTEDAVKSFKRSVGLPADGIVDEQTWDALEEQTSAPESGKAEYPTLKLWDGFATSNPQYQDDVKRLQEALQKLGYDVDVDGLFGLDTEDAIKDFQLVNDLTTDGVVDKTTWQALEQSVNKQGIQKPARKSPPEETQRSFTPRDSSGAPGVSVSSYSEGSPEESSQRPTLKYKDGFPDTTPHLKEDVKYMQQLLGMHGYSVEADGQFGKGTEDAVKKFQQDWSLTADGVVGPSTWQALESIEAYSDETEESPDDGGREYVTYSGSSSGGYPDRGSTSYPDRGSESDYEESSSGGYPDRGAESTYDDRGSGSGSSDYPDRGEGEGSEDQDSGGYPDRGEGEDYEEPESSSGGYPDRGEGEDYEETESSSGGYPDRGTSSSGYPDRESGGSSGYPDRESGSGSSGSSSGGYPDRETGTGSGSQPEQKPPEKPEPQPPKPPVPSPPPSGTSGGSILYYPPLRYQDGYSDNNPHLNRDVRRLQTALNEAGFSTGTDGMFGSGTEDLVKDFQKKNGITADGVVQSDTWKALEKYGIPKAESPVLKYFWGDPNWVHNWEGHNGSAYWPGGSSGVTLDPGMDLGHADPSLIEDLYKPILTSDQYRACTSVFGIQGDAANKALNSNPVLQSIRISREQADEIFDYAAVPYWDGIVNRFNTLIYADTLASVQTALLSLSYNRGYNNSDLEQLRSPLERKDWWEVADRIGNMQQDHELEGIRKRRQAEGELIKWELNWLAEYL